MQDILHPHRHDGRQQGGQTDTVVGEDGRASHQGCFRGQHGGRPLPPHAICQQRSDTGARHEAADHRKAGANARHLAVGNHDAQARAVAAHEGQIEAGQLRVADGVDKAGKRGEAKHRRQCRALWRLRRTSETTWEACASSPAHSGMATVSCIRHDAVGRGTGPGRSGLRNSPMANAGHNSWEDGSSRCDQKFRSRHQGLEAVENGTVGWARTTDLRIHNPAL